ncbi:hypothetical protein HRbin16_00162 [bacterium HR16]|nr:hypothetical protein HRbin16_00162 [bacterium HR16]
MKWMQWYVVTSDTMDWKFEVRRKEDLYLPGVYCPTCDQSGFLIAAAEVPEPVLPEVRKLLEPYPHEIPREMMERLWYAMESDASTGKDEAKQVDKEIELFLSVTPEQFFAIEQTIRRIYNFSPKRLVSPNAGVGPLVVRKGFKPKWDVLCHGVLGDSLYFSRRAGDELLEAGVTGLELFPVYTRDGKPSEVYEAVVTGYAGLPSLVSPGGEYFQCPECKRWYLRGDHPLKIRLDESQWDGSDFFHVSSYSGVYISQRAYEILNSPFFSTEVWVSLKPMDGTWVHPDFDLAGNLFS